MNFCAYFVFSLFFIFSLIQAVPLYYVNPPVLANPLVQPQFLRHEELHRSHLHLLQQLSTLFSPIGRVNQFLNFGQFPAVYPSFSSNPEYPNMYNTMTSQVAEDLKLRPGTNPKVIGADAAGLLLDVPQFHEEDDDNGVDEPLVVAKHVTDLGSGASGILVKEDNDTSTDEVVG